MTMNRRLYLTALVLLFVTGRGWADAASPPDPDGLVLPGETHFKNLRQLTFGGENAEAYFSHDGRELIFQSTRDGLACDAIFRMNADGSNVRRVSSGRGVTTCSFIAPDNQSIIYASTHRSPGSLPAEAGLLAGLRLAAVQGLRHLPRGAERRAPGTR